MRILFLSHTAAGGTFRVGSHHLAGELARRPGLEVHHVATPVTPAHAVRRQAGDNFDTVRRRGMRRHVDAAGVHHYTPILPTPLGRGPAAVAAASAALCGRLVRRAVGPADLVLVDQPLFADVLPHLTAGRVVYRPTDIQAAPALVDTERRLAGWVDRVVVTTAAVHAALPASLAALPHIELPNGVDLSAFAGPPPGAARSGAVYVGSLDERFDWAAVAALARANPDVALDVYGPPAEPAPPALPPSVTVRGAVAFDRLPALLGAARVGLLPLSDDIRNTSRSPMKLWEYLAAGLRVVARDTPPLRALPAPGVLLYSSHEQAAAMLAEALRAGPNPDGVAAAARHGWAAKADRLLAFAGGPDVIAAGPDVPAPGGPA